MRSPKRECLVSLTENFVLHSKMRTILLGLFIGLVVISSAIVGCKQRSPTGPAAIASAAPPLPGVPIHLHGPHGGHAVNLGYLDHNAELMYAPGEPIVGVYTLGADITKIEPVDSQSVSLFTLVDRKVTEYKLPAVHHDEDPPNKFSYFEIKSKPLYEVASGISMAIRPRLRLAMTIEGLPYSGEIDTSAGSHLSVIQSFDSGPVGEPIIWQKQITEGQFNINLGHFSVLLLAGKDVEPAVQLTRGEQPVTDAKVAVALLAEDAKTELAPEAAATFQPAAGDNAAHYGKGILKMPPRTRKAVIRYRVALPEDKGEHTYDLPVSVQ